MTQSMRSKITEMTKYSKLIILYCLACLLFGIWNTKRVLSNDIKTGKMEYGRVSLLCSYWYECYFPNELLKWYKKNIDKPLLPIYFDKAATPLYLKKNNILLESRTTEGDSVYVLTIYASRFGIGERRVNPKLQWQNIYLLERE